MQARDQSLARGVQCVESMLGATWGWLLAGLVMAAPLSNSKHERVRVAVLPVSVRGDAAGLTRDALHERVLRGLDSARLEVTTETKAARLAACESHACRQRTASMSGVTHWLMVDLEGRDRTYDARLRLFAVGEKAPVMEATDRCVICGRAEIDDLVGAQAVVVKDWLEQRDGAVAHIHVTSKPAGASVMIDGRPVGRAPVTATVEPGEHRVELRALRHHPVTKTLEVGRGVTEHVNGRLTRKDLKLWPWGAAALSAGVPMLGAGAVLLAVDGNPYERRCGADDAANFDVDGDCRYVHDTFTPGVALTVVGAISTVAGVTLVTIDAVRGTKGRDLRARVGPGTVSLVGRF